MTRNYFVCLIFVASRYYLVLMYEPAIKPSLMISEHTTLSAHKIAQQPGSDHIRSKSHVDLKKLLLEVRTLNNVFLLY